MIARRQQDAIILIDPETEKSHFCKQPRLPGESISGEDLDSPWRPLLQLWLKGKQKGG